MKLGKTILLLALMYIVLGPLLLLTETTVWGAEGSMQALPITCLGVFFFLFSYISLHVHRCLLRQKPQGLLGYYMAAKALRLVLSLILLVVYGFAVGRGVLPFALNLFVYYVATLVFMAIYFRSHEKKSITSHETT